MKTRILVGIILLGVATVVFAAEGPSSGSAKDPSRSTPRGMADWQAQNVETHQFISPDGTVTVTCPWQNPNYRNSAGYYDSAAPVNSDATKNYDDHQRGCRHWYRWFVPGHSTHCGWTNAARSMSTACCW